MQVVRSAARQQEVAMKLDADLFKKAAREIKESGLMRCYSGVPTGKSAVECVEFVLTEYLDMAAGDAVITVLAEGDLVAIVSIVFSDGSGVEILFVLDGNTLDGSFVPLELFDIEELASEIAKDVLEQGARLDNLRALYAERGGTVTW